MSKWKIYYVDNTCNNQVWETKEEYDMPSKAIKEFLETHNWLLEQDINSISKS